MSDSASTARIDYLQRSGIVPELAAGGATSAPPATRRLLRVAGVGRPDKDAESGAHDTRARWRPPTVELVTGLYGYRIPLAFNVLGSPDGARVHVGLWSGHQASDA